MVHYPELSKFLGEPILRRYLLERRILSETGSPTAGAKQNKYTNIKTKLGMEA